MSRRRIVVLASAGTLLGLFTIVVLALATLTRTQWGHEKIRRFAEGRLNKAIKGKLYIGRIGGSLLGGVSVDSLELRDLNDSLFLAAGKVSASFNVADILDMRIALRDVTMERAVVHIDIDSAGTVNFRKIFPPGPPGPPRTTRAWGDYFALRNTAIRGFTLQVRMPWHPDTSARGVRRDSLIAYALSRKDKEIRRVPWGYQQTLRWTDGSLALDSARLDDRGPGGRTISIRNLDLNGFDPPFNFRNMRGIARMQADSLFVDIPHFDLPASTGSGKGKVWWGGPGPIRYDLHIVGDSVSLADVNWVYPTLPKTGGGKLNLVIRSESDPRLVDYILTEMDVRSMDSWLRGRMTFGIGAPITILKDVDLVAQPVDFRLIEQISGAPLPYPFRGTLSGTLKARGGPLNRFVVDASDIIYRDANVPGATTIGSGVGELDILKPSNTAFHSFNLQLDQLDLRTVQFLNPSFPKLDGIIAGRTTLDSTLLDVRFRNADLTHSNGTGPVTHATGAGRVTFGEFTTYDVALNAQPLSFTTLAHSYKDGRIPFRGEYQGPLRLQGTLQDLDVSTELRGPSGIVVYDGRVDADSVGGYGAHGALRFGSLDLRTFLDSAITPPTQLTGHADLDVAGDSLATLKGSATIELERSLFDSVRVYPSRTRLRFADRHLFVDTLDLQSVVATVSARGALGLALDTRDSLAFTVDADSLGGLRRYLATAVVEDTAGDPVALDSLLATIHGTGQLYGSVDSLRAHVALDARDVDAMAMKAEVVRLDANFDDVTGKPKGKTSLTADTLTVGGMRIQSLGADLTLADSASGEFSVLASAFDGPVLESAGRLEMLDDTTIVHLRTVGISMRNHRLTMPRETMVRVEPNRITLDSLRLDGEHGEELLLAADLPSDRPIRGIFRADSVHVADFADLSQRNISLGGLLTGQIELKGTRLSPEITLVSKIVQGNVGQVKIATIEMNGQYLDRRARAGLQVYQQDTAVLAVSANIPIDLAFASRARRFLNDTLRVTMRSRDVDLRLLESFSTSIRNSSGRFTAQLDLAGPKSTAQLVGTVAITDAAASLPTLGIVLRQFNANIDAANDTIAFKRFSVVSGDQNDDRLSLEGFIARPLHNDRDFDLTFTARNFRAIGSKKLAELVISTSPPLRIVGSWDGASRLTGAVVVNRGVIYMPPSTDKQLITLDPDDLAGLDTAAVARLQLLPKAPPAIVRNLVIDNVTLQIGPDVWLRSAESREMNVKLGGALSVTTGARSRDGTPQLALNGGLQTERGTYLLNIGGIVQRTFAIEGGNLQFYDDPALNPSLDISAIYSAPQFSVTYGGRNDVRIRARIRGTLSEPRLFVESADSLALSQSDLISYLLVGGPSLDITGGRNSYNQLFGVGLSSVANLSASLLVGRFVDYVQVQTAAERLQTANLTNANILTGTLLGLGKQLNDRTFLALNAGVCQFLKGSSQLDPITLAQNIGVKLEYQIKPQIGIAASSEPSLSALFCGQARGFTTSVRQYGFDLFRTLRW